MRLPIPRRRGLPVLRNVRIPWLAQFAVDSPRIQATFPKSSMRILLALFLFAAGGPIRGQAAEFTMAQSGRIAQLVGKILQQSHYRQTPLDDAISGMFLTNYLDALDYNHMIFLEADVRDFADRYATKLDDLTKLGDVTPGFEIFGRYLQRLSFRHETAQQIIQEPLDFSTNDSVQRTRSKAPWPKDDAEAERLWRGRIKSELLQDRLIKLKSAATNAPAKPGGAPRPAPATAPANAPATASAPATNALAGVGGVASSPDEVRKTISKRYERLLKNMKDFSNEEILQVYLSSLARAFDPHTDYMSPTEAADFDINSIKLKLSGIGARLRWEDGFTRVESLVPGGPAALSKQLKPNDRIIAVAQGDGKAVDVVEMKLRKVVDLIRGQKGTEVRLTVVPADGSASRIVPLLRDEIKIAEQFAKAKVVDHYAAPGATNRWGVVVLPQFYDHCAKDVEKLIGRLQKENITGLVLDLRHNGGGLLDEAIQLTGLFIGEGPVVQVKDSRRRNQVCLDDDDKVAYAGPLVVLVDHLSASASEITAAALQDYGRAVIVGDPATHGKGTVQSVISLNQFLRQDVVADPGKLKLTVSKFYRIAGGTTQQHGVAPDIQFPSIYDAMELGEAHLPNCLPADETTPVAFAAIDRTKPYLGDLRARSQERLRHSQDFAYVQEDVQRLKKQRDEQTVSLNESKLLKEQADDEARKKARKDERAQRKPAPDKLFEVNLAMVDKNEPLQPAGLKQKENEALAAVSDPEIPDGLEDTVGTNQDFVLEEALAILADYSGLLTKAGQSVVVNDAKPAVPVR
jgi:carboxyl-terminal processing protease